MAGVVLRDMTGGCGGPLIGEAFIAGCGGIGEGGALGMNPGGRALNCWIGCSEAIAPIDWYRPMAGEFGIVGISGWTGCGGGKFEATEWGVNMLAVISRSGVLYPVEDGPDYTNVSGQYHIHGV